MAIGEFIPCDDDLAVGLNGDLGVARETFCWNALARGKPPAVLGEARDLQNDTLEPHSQGELKRSRLADGRDLTERR
jgi:hypothetical protein